MQGSNYLVAAYAIAWVGIFVYLAFIAIRIRAVRTELAAVTELVRTSQPQENIYGTQYQQSEEDVNYGNK